MSKDYKKEAERLAKVLAEKLSREDFDSLEDVLGDDTTDGWLYAEIYKIVQARRSG